MKYGIAYMVVLPGDPQPVIRPVSPRRLTALYADDVDDPWPEYAVEETVLKPPAASSASCTSTTTNAVHADGEADTAGFLA